MAHHTTRMPCSLPVIDRVLHRALHRAHDALIAQHHDTLLAVRMVHGPNRDGKAIDCTVGVQ